MLGAQVADITLRLDDAVALPACPEPQQRQQTARIAACYQISEQPCFQLKKMAQVIPMIGSTLIGLAAP